MLAWERLPEETDLAYSAFVEYLSARNVSELSKICQKSRQQLTTWAKKYRWRERAAAYDSSLVESARQEKIARQKSALARKEELASLLIEKAEQMLKELPIKRGSFRSATEMLSLGFELADEALADSSGDNELTIKIVCED